MYILTREIETMAGNKEDTVLCRCNDSKELAFLQGFQARNSTELVFSTYQEIVDYLRKNLGINVIVGCETVYYSPYTNATIFSHYADTKEI